ncbi:hypothetical protein BAOM_2986 [Peribacillus asahii]|uniref:Uncharacterized protein n=1 Tax=Peribacillus asahii TaxID=228899 RepID=A0A3T0KTL8_9BACI|nr:hypothetical protein [Peribacillus asahii]AZV43595.1 hypothetical protein BAOM_2986 [Peribacillus asahii]
MEELANGVENGIEYKVVWKYGDYVYINVKDTLSNREQLYEYKLIHRPIFGIDIADHVEIKKKLDEMIDMVSK